MNGSYRRIAASALAAACATLLYAAPAQATPGVTWTIDPLTLPPALRQQALTAPIGRYGPFGEPAEPGCLWSRIQVPTVQGLRWLVEEVCDDQGSFW